MMNYFFKTKELPSWIVPIKKLILSDKSGNWCRLPYEDHPDGCPNYGNKLACPPLAPFISSQIDINREMYLVHSEFNLRAHTIKMRTKHPKWSDRQCKCVLYWQSTSRKQRCTRTDEAVRLLGTNWISSIPEAMGVNVYATARLSGLKLERIRDIKVCRHVALLAYKR